MVTLDSRVFGTPKDLKKEQQENEVVKAPEFDITQYAKKLGVVVGVISPAVVAALKSFGVNDITTPVVVAALGVTAVALFSASVVMAVDLAARAYLTRGEPKEKGKTEPGSESGHSASGQGTTMVAAPAGSLVWLKESDESRPLLAISREADGGCSYLVAGGATVQRGEADRAQQAIDGSAEWHPDKEIHGIKPAKWPPK
jgi:hypothetical protein